MEEKKLDEMIEKNIKGASIEIDISQSIIDRVTDFEIQKSQIPGRHRFILAVYSAMISLFSIFFLEMLSQKHQNLLARFDLGTIKVILQGVSALVFILLLGFLLFSPFLKKNTEPT